MAEMTGPLAGLKVVELATAIQGPAVGLHFANMGADVVKVEPPIGDPSRLHRGINNELPAEAMGSQFVAMNKGKRSVALDIHTPLGLRATRELISKADLFVSNYRASALSRMGLDIDELSEEHPRLVVGHVNGFGPHGPDADKAMLDGAAQARGGINSLTGYDGQAPMPNGAAIGDHAGAMQLALACTTALVTRSVTGRGQVVRTSSLGAQLWLQMWELQHSFMTGVPLERSGPHHPNIRGPYGVYPTQDGIGICFVHAMVDDAWAAFWIFVDRPDVLLMEQWDNPAKRLGMAGSSDGLAEIRELMTSAFASKTFTEWREFLSTQPEIIWEQVRTHAEVGEDPQNLANDYVVDLDLPASGMTKTVGTLMEFAATPTSHPSVPPGLGQHSAEILAECGLSPDEAASVIDHATSVRDEMYRALWGSD